MIHLLAFLVPFIVTLAVHIIIIEIKARKEEKRIRKEMDESLERFDDFLEFQRRMIKIGIIINALQYELSKENA